MIVDESCQAWGIPWIRFWRAARTELIGLACWGTRVGREHLTASNPVMHLTS